MALESKLEHPTSRGSHGRQQQQARAQDRLRPGTKHKKGSGAGRRRSGGSRISAPARRLPSALHVQNRLDGSENSAKWPPFRRRLASLAQSPARRASSLPSKSNEAWKGPPVWVESTSDWTVVAEPPIGGWRINLVQILGNAGHNEVFITLQPPTLMFIVTPVAVQQRIGDLDPNSTPIWVYARQMNWKGEPAPPDRSCWPRSEGQDAP